MVWGLWPTTSTTLFFTCPVLALLCGVLTKGMVAVCVRVEITRMLCASEECENGVERD